MGDRDTGNGGASLADRVRSLLVGRRERVPSSDLIDELGLDHEDAEKFFWSITDHAEALKWSPEEAWSHVPTLLDALEDLLET